MTNTIKLLAVASVFLASSAFAANPPAAPEREAQPTFRHRRPLPTFRIPRSSFPPI